MPTYLTLGTNYILNLFDLCEKTKIPDLLEKSGNMFITNDLGMLSDQTL
ncbi:hypothetical protein COO91_02979 [Nostoc flagelliforme CCNUN1]|uniref:Uncharacterized protein n=1 Tax=Nostoc flagelliforme CCNUN1 TaxID=2038116 RepID=A0A2K8SNQ1_9NOSO|nr:hypothetical protein COO91_02979 [Nostoc flagelliforme CCNUN1]